jgi:hypothetical protein
MWPQTPILRCVFDLGVVGGFLGVTFMSTFLYILPSLADFREVGLSRGEVDPSS